MLSLANNSFSGELPSFLVTQPPVVEDACAENGCIVRVLINGPDSNVQVRSAMLAMGAMGASLGWIRVRCGLELRESPCHTELCHAHLKLKI